ncbi:MAG: branched-chain amino acid ABC transporter permease [Gammaproteobacteria bacterium]|nr:branched-chain amino acid ABC transporter permease [Gammaproteobacteria bacterium]
MPVAQVIINSIIRASELSLIAIGLTLVYDLLKFANFAHTEYAVVGVYLAFIFNVNLGLSIFTAVLLSAILTGLIAISIDRMVFRRMRDSGRVILMVTSFGLAIALRNTIRAIWGPTPRSFTIGLQRPISFLGIRITPVQIWIIATAVIFMVAFHLLLHKTKLGKAMRASSDNPALAQASGIATEGVILWVWFIATSFAAVGGILIALETYLLPHMGFAIIIPVFCATILGGIGNPYGAMLGALALGFAENFGLYLNFGDIINLGGLFDLLKEIHIPTGYRDAISFGILIAILLTKPSGILGKRG